jgi:DNA polymerase I-like protein with 3'-5' exonuclease and polymerase domains
MNILTLDFETYYDQKYSLSKTTTEEYVRSDLFEAIGVSVQVDDGTPEWFTGTMQEIGNWLNRYPWQDAMLVAHNSMFDAAILSWRFDIHPKVIADTLSMARAKHGVEVGGSLAKLAEFYQIGVKGTEVINALGKRRLAFTPEDLARYGEYCCNDTKLTYELFTILMETFPKTEMRLIDQTIKMFTEPVLELDAFLLEQHLSDIKARKEELLAKVAGDAEEAKKNIMSNPKFAQLLKEFGVEPPMKISPTTGKLTHAFAKTDEGMKELLEHSNPDVQILAAVRLGVKSTLEETRTERFLGIAQRGKLPIPLKYYAAHTSRWGGTDKINLQNLPSRGADAGKLKQAIRPPEGYVIIDSDSSQIEARTLAWMAGQDDLVEAFRKGEDVYKIMASAIYRKPVEEISKPERFVGKSTVLGCGYGMGAKKFKLFMQMAGVEMSQDEAAHIISTYRMTYPTIPNLWGQGDKCLRALVDNQSAPYGKEGVVQINGFLGVLTPNGIPLRYHELRRARNAKGEEEIVYTSRTGITGIWGGKLTENLIQHLARCIVGEQLLRIAKRYRVVLTVHDAVACVAPKEEAFMAQAYVEECMRWTPAWAEGLPLNCESGIGENYGEC